jgi:hypothetical protein
MARDKKFDSALFARLADDDGLILIFTVTGLLSS